MKMIYSIFTWNVEKKIIHISRAILWFHVYSKVGNLRYANSPNRILNLKFETNAQMQRFAFQLPVNPFPVAISSHMDLCSWCFCISVKSWSGLCRVIDWSEICLTGQTYSSPIQPLTSLLMMMMMMLKICGKDSFRHPSASSHMTNHYFQNFSLN